MKLMRMTGRIIRRSSLVLCTGIALLLISILIRAKVSPIPVFFMRQRVVADGVLNIALCDDYLFGVSYVSSFQNEADLLQYVDIEQSDIDAYYETLALLHEGRVLDDDYLNVNHYVELRKDVSPFQFHLFSPSSVSLAVYEGSTHKGMRTITYATTYLSFPVWAPLIPLCAYPTVAFLRGPYRRHRRRKKGLCTTCGYNLTGNVTGVCPECGERI